MIKQNAILLILLSSLFLASCATQKIIPLRDDPLIGKIVQVKTGRSINFAHLIASASSADVIYLSEKHDNPDHHEFQKKFIKALVEKGIEPVIGFEFFAMADTPDLLNFIDSANVAHSEKSMRFIEADLRRKLGWDTQPDKMWKYYFDLLSLARDNRLFAAGLDLGSSIKRRITRKGIDGLSSLEKSQLFSTHLADKAYKDYMIEIFKSVHCGMGGHGNLSERLYETWLARNDKMALSITNLARKEHTPVVVIVGGGHTEYGLGLVNRVAALAPDLKQINIALKEIDVTPSALSQYLEPLTLKGHDMLLPADYMRFSQRVSYEDPCEAFRKQIEKMKQHKKQ